MAKGLNSVHDIVNALLKELNRLLFSWKTSRSHAVLVYFVREHRQEGLTNKFIC
jgi:hypothetical protein